MPRGKKKSGPKKAVRKARRVKDEEEDDAPKKRGRRAKEDEVEVDESNVSVSEKEGKLIVSLNKKQFPIISAFLAEMAQIAQSAKVETEEEEEKETEEEEEDEPKPKKKGKPVDEEEEEEKGEEEEEEDEPKPKKKKKDDEEEEEEDDEKKGEEELTINEDEIAVMEKDDLVEIALKVGIENPEKMKEKQLRAEILAIAVPDEKEKEEAEEEASDEEFEVGEKVTALYPDGGSEWYPAVIEKKFKSGKFQVEWADGDEDNTIVEKVKKRIKKK